MGQPVVHWEFWSPEPGRAAEFYQRVFEWEIRTIPELDYRLGETGGENGINGGIMTPKAGPWPAKLALYIDVDDIDKFIQRIQEAGGKTSAEDSSSRSGRALALRGSRRAGARNLETGP